MMKACVRDEYCEIDQFEIRDVPVESPGPGEMLVRVEVSTVSRTDCGVATGKPFPIRFFAGLRRPKIIMTGTDFAGDVLEVGDGVSFSPGDRVYGFCDDGLGSHAERLLVPKGTAVTKIPEGVSYEDAAASIEGFHYALNGLNRVQLRPGDRAFVNGGTGAIGSAAIQLLKSRGVFVAATAPDGHLDTVAALGADQVIAFEQRDFTDASLYPDVFRFIFDAVGKSSFSAVTPLLAKNGVYISSELGPNNENPWLALATPLTGGRRVKFPIPVDIPGSLKESSKMLAAATFRPLIDRYYSLDDAVEAFRYVDSGQKIGNVLLRPS